MLTCARLVRVLFCASSIMATNAAASGSQASQVEKEMDEVIGVARRGGALV